MPKLRTVAPSPDIDKILIKKFELFSTVKIFNFFVSKTKFLDTDIVFYLFSTVKIFNFFISKKFLDTDVV